MLSAAHTPGGGAAARAAGFWEILEKHNPPWGSRLLGLASLAEAGQPNGAGA